MQSSRKNSTVIGQVLKEIISDVNVSTQRSTVYDFDQIKLREAVIFLERKIQRQNSQIKVLVDQLSSESNLKQEMLILLNQEKEKNNKISAHLVSSNKATAQLKKKLSKYQEQQLQHHRRDEYELKINKYRQIVRKKDELLSKNQQRLEELQKNQSSRLELQKELKQLKQSFLRLKNREIALTTELQSYKKRFTQAQQRANQAQQKFKDLQEKCMFAQEMVTRLQSELEYVKQDHQRQHEQTKSIEQAMKKLLDSQNDQIRKMTEAQTIRATKPQCELFIYKNEVKRILGSHLKDNHVRKKVEKEVLSVIEEMEGSFNKIVAHMINNMP